MVGVPYASEKLSLRLAHTITIIHLRTRLGAPRAERGIAQYTAPLLDSLSRSLHHTLFLG